MSEENKNSQGKKISLINLELKMFLIYVFQMIRFLNCSDIEMVVGGIDEDPSISQYVSSSIPYHQDDLTWCVAKAKRKYSLFSFLSSFKPGTWILTFIFILTASLTIVISQKMLKIKWIYVKGYFSVIIRIYGIILTQSIHLRYMPMTLKISFISVFFLALMFTNIYQSFLVSTLTTPRSSYQISHIEEIYEHRMIIMGSVENVRHLNKEGEVCIAACGIPCDFMIAILQIFKYIRQQYQMCYNIEQCLKEAATNDRVAVAVSRQHTFYNPRIPREDLYCFDRNENLYVYLVTMLLPKKFHLLHKINPVIQHIIESGHMQKWARDLDMKRIIHEEVHKVREHSSKSLTLAQVAGSFLFAFILLVLATLVFLLELWVHWMVTHKRTRLKIVKYLHRQFK